MAEQQINSQIQTNNEELTNTITLHDIIRMVIANWYWFVLSTVCCLCAAYYYLASTPKIYSRTATILVKDSRKGETWTSRHSAIWRDSRTAATSTTKYSSSSRGV